MKNLEKIFNPESVAVVGASGDKNSVGYAVLKNLVSGGVISNEYCKPFAGKIYAVNPNAEWILNIKCHPSLKSIDGDVDLAVVCVAAKSVLSVMNDCVKKGVKNVVILSSGFAESGREGGNLQNAVVKLAAKNNMNILGPNCLGIIRPGSRLNASFAPTMPPKGSVALITQSGAVADGLIESSVFEKYGVSAIVSVGNQAGVDVSDLLEWFAADEQTRAIALYVESIDNGERFIKIAKKVSRTKPIVALKPGRMNRAIAAIKSHTGSNPTGYEVYEAAFEQAGVVSTYTLEELFDVAKVLSQQPACRNSVGIITNGGGPGVLCTDYCEQFGVALPELDKKTIKKLDSSGRMHPSYSKNNPLDIMEDALSDRYDIAVNALLEENKMQGLIVLQALQAMTNPEANAKVIIDAHRAHPEKPVVCCFMGETYSKRGIELLEANGIPNYKDPKRAARAMTALIERYDFLNKQRTQ